MAATFQDIIDWKPPVEDDLEPYRNLINVLDHHFPKDWRSWEVVNLTYSELFGESIFPDTETKLQFAVPTDDLMRCFNRNAVSMSEQDYASIKRQLMQWPIGRAIICSPNTIVQKIHTGKFYSKFMDVVKDLEPKLILRIGAPAKLDIKDDCPSTSRRRRASSDEDGAPPVKLTSEEKQIMDMLSEQNQMLIQLSNMAKSKKSGGDLKKAVASSDASINENNEPNSASQLESTQFISEEASNFNLENETSINNEAINFALQTEIMSDVPGPADPEDGQDNICGATSWAGLKVNPILASVTPRYKFLAELENMDRILATVIDKLLKQQECLREILESMPAEIQALLGEALLGQGAEYRRSTEALVALVRGRREEAAAQRRAVYAARCPRLHRRLHAIPPSRTHLFDEARLADLVRRHGGVENFFLGGVRKPKRKQ